MRKRILVPNTAEFPSTGPDWLDRERLTRVELSSEDPAHPAEAAVIPGDTRGWRAAHSGEQTIRLLFDERLDLRQIRQVSTETEHERTRALDLEVVEEWRHDIPRDNASAVSLQPIGYAA